MNKLLFGFVLGATAVILYAKKRGIDLWKTIREDTTIVIGQLRK